MILDSGTSSSDTKVKDDDYKIKNSKLKTLYLGIICFTTNCLSSIALEAGSRSSSRSISPRPAVFNNLFRRNYNLRIKIMVGDVLAALVSTTMLTIGNTYGIPYLYLPWLVNTIEGMAFHEVPALYELAHTVLPNANLPTGLFMFLTLLLFVEELCIWKDVVAKFQRCWTKYNKNKQRRDAKPTEMANKELYDEVKGSLAENIVERKSTDERERDSTAHFNESNNYGVTESVAKNVKDNVSIKSRRSKGPFTEVTG